MTREVIWGTPSSLAGKLVRWEPEEATERRGGYPERLVAEKEADLRAETAERGPGSSHIPDAAAPMAMLSPALCPFALLSRWVPTFVLIRFLPFATRVLMNMTVMRQNRLQLDSLPAASTKPQYRHALRGGPRVMSLTLTLREKLCQGQVPGSLLGSSDLCPLIIPGWHFQ